MDGLNLLFIAFLVKQKRHLRFDVDLGKMSCRTVVFGIFFLASFSAYKISLKIAGLAYKN